MGNGIRLTGLLCTNAPSSSTTSSQPFQQCCPATPSPLYSCSRVSTSSDLGCNPSHAPTIASSSLTSCLGQWTAYDGLWQTRPTRRLSIYCQPTASTSSLRKSDWLCYPFTDVSSGTVIKSLLKAESFLAPPLLHHAITLSLLNAQLAGNSL